MKPSMPGKESKSLCRMPFCTEDLSWVMPEMDSFSSNFLNMMTNFRQVRGSFKTGQGSRGSALNSWPLFLKMGQMFGKSATMSILGFDFARWHLVALKVIHSTEKSGSNC